MGTFHVLTVSENKTIYTSSTFCGQENTERQYIQDVCSSEIMDNSFFLLYHSFYFPNILQLGNGFSFFNKTKLIGQESLCPRKDEHLTANLYSDRWLGCVSNWLSCCVAGP